MKEKTAKENSQNRLIMIRSDMQKSKLVIPSENEERKDKGMKTIVEDYKYSSKREEMQLKDQKYL